MSGRSLDKILFLQKSDLLEEQKPQVLEHIGRALPDASISFAGKPEEVPFLSFDSIIAPTLPWLPDALARTQQYRWVHFLSAGVERIWDMPVDWSDITLTKSSGIHGPQMSEYVIGAMLYFAKGFDRFVEQSREALWSRFWLSELTGQAVMILGAGHIGEWIIRRCKSFDMQVTAVTRSGRPVPGADASTSLAEASRALGEMDYLVVCLPFTEETAALVDETFLSALKPGAVLIDISRGGIVESGAVLDALDAGRLRGAALDVFEEEPVPDTSRLWRRRDVLLTPHVSGTSPHYLSRALDVFLVNARNWVSGVAELPSSVNKCLKY
ncbi:D-2-hydroxyacid dehydrogenase [Parvibaculum sp.]|uniref:D-2-hydroxyacid dehydrogenase n=1 Tax=Parvibaculum sp. TaxID=2024848 RepID=UPI003C70D9EB